MKRELIAGIDAIDMLSKVQRKNNESFCSKASNTPQERL
jgi:hypothetical protein